MKSSEILTRATKLVDSGVKAYCCSALHCADASIDTKNEFESLFKPTGVKSLSPWFGDCYDSKCHKHRVLALLMCAAIAADQGD